jgi:hypothetical protein
MLHIVICKKHLEGIDGCDKEDLLHFPDMYFGVGTDIFNS